MTKEIKEYYTIDDFLNHKQEFKPSLNLIRNLRIREYIYTYKIYDLSMYTFGVAEKYLCDFCYDTHKCKLISKKYDLIKYKFYI